MAPYRIVKVICKGYLHIWLCMGGLSAHGRVKRGHYGGALREQGLSASGHDDHDLGAPVRVRPGAGILQGPATPDELKQISLLRRVRELNEPLGAKGALPEPRRKALDCRARHRPVSPQNETAIGRLMVRRQT
jgi:hypothetical protein